MANELNIALAKSGLTVTAQPYQSGAAVGSAISCPEVGSTGFYSGNMAGSAGTYQIAFRASSANVGSGSIVWDGTAEVAPSTLTTGDLPSVPSAASVATAVRTELTELSNLDASVSSRLASASYTSPANSDISAIKSKTDNLPASPAAVSDIPTTAQISAAVEGSLLDENDGQAVLNAIVGAIGNTNLSEVSLVAAVRADLERVGGKIDSIPTSSAPSASTVAGAVRTELSTELARVDAAVSTRLAGSAYTAPANSDVAAIKVKTDALNTERLANVATTAIVGNLLAQANS
jgi:hypothetical protein